MPPLPLPSASAAAGAAAAAAAAAASPLRLVVDLLALRAVHRQACELLRMSAEGPAAGRKVKGECSGWVVAVGGFFFFWEGGREWIFFGVWCE